MNVWAIKHKPTGNFLAEREKHRKRGYTYDDPVPASVRLPRLFATSVAAKLALRAWLQGEWNMYRGASNWGEEYYEELSIKPRIDRKAEDMEIVPITILGLI